MRAKYVEERYPRLMLMGYHGSSDAPDDNLTTADDRFNIRVTPADGKALVAYSDRVHDILERMADAFDKADSEAFKGFWYEQENHK
jgi:hypothetical protein